VAATPDRALGEARGALDRGDGRAALRHLDRARRGYAKQRDADGLEHVLDMAALVDAADDRARIGRDNLAYAVKQNLRQETRRAARERKEPWTDPYPDLQAPTEHTGLALTRGVKLWIAVGVAVAVAAVVGIIVAIALTDTTQKTVTLRLVNDTGRSVTVRGCDDPDCTTSFLHHQVDPGAEADADVDTETLVQVFRLEQPGADRCLPLRVHDAFLRLGSGGGTLSARLSQATPCPGTTVLPRASESTPL
jgi:hypothetical protein